MKKLTSLLFAITFVAVFSCKRTDEVSPARQAVDEPNDSLKIQDIELNSKIIAGSYNHTGAADGTGASARFHGPMGIFTKSDGSLLVADYNNGAVRRISTANVVTSPYHPPYSPIDIAAIADGAVGVVGNSQVTVYNHGTHVTRPAKCSGPCTFVGIDKDPVSKFFWHGVNLSLSDFGFQSWLNSIDELSLYPINDILISDNRKGGSTIPITSFSVATNDNKFLTTTNRVYECTHSGTVFPILSGFTNLTSIVVSRDGTKLFIADAGVIKLITRNPVLGPILITLLSKEDAYGLALSNNEKALYFTSRVHHTVSQVVLP